MSAIPTATISSAESSAESPAVSASMPPNRRLERAAPGAASAAASIPETAAARIPRRSRRGVVGAWWGRLQLLTGIVVVIAASVFVAWGFRQYLRSSKRFSVRTVVVEGNSRLTPKQVARLAGLKIGDNIFSVDEQEAALAIASDPWVAEAEIAVDLPNRLVITVVEREAHALATVAGTLYLVDVDGEIFKRRVDGDPHDLPILSGIEAEAIATDREGVMAQLRRGIELAGELERAGLAKRFPIQEVHITIDTNLTVILGSDGMALQFGQPPYRAKIAKAKRIIAELSYRKVKPAVIFLDNRARPERVVVRLR